MVPMHAKNRKEAPHEPVPTQRPNQLTGCNRFPLSPPATPACHGANLRGEGKGEGLILRSWSHFIHRRERGLSMNPCQPNALTNSPAVTGFPSPLPLRRLVTEPI